MKPVEFDNLQRVARELYEAQPKKPDKLSLDAIFIGVAVSSISSSPARTAPKPEDDTPPEWFNETLQRLRGSGERMTVSRFLMLAGRFPATRKDQLDAGRWLRAAGLDPQKVGGNLLFEL